MVRVRYFAGAREAVGRADEDVELEPGAVVGDLRRLLAARHPALAGAGGARIAVDHRFATEATPLAEGAEVAWIPPVGGG